MKENGFLSTIIASAINKLSSTLSDFSDRGSSSNKKSGKAISKDHSAETLPSETLDQDENDPDSPPNQSIHSPSTSQVPLGEGELRLEDFNRVLQDDDQNSETKVTTPVADGIEAEDTKSAIHSFRSTSPALESAQANTSAQGNSFPQKRLSSVSSSRNLSNITGYANANSKRNREFHQLFKSVPDDDYLIEDYGCALQRDIFLHGRMYLSEKHICFNSSIFGWVTNIVIPFSEVVSVEKKYTAVVFPNAIQITTLHARYLFASFLSRDTTYQLIVTIWKHTHPFLSIFANGHGIMDAGNKKDKTGGDLSASEHLSSTNESDDEDKDGAYESDGSTETSANSDIDDDLTAEGVADAGTSPDTSGDGPAKMQAAFRTLEHAPTEWPGTPYDHVLCNGEVINKPLGTTFSMLFGDNSSWFADFLQSQKMSQIQIDLWEEKDHLFTRKLHYMKPVAPPYRQTMCYLTDTIDHLDANSYIQISSTTSTPQVPSGKSFLVKTQYVLTWGENNTTKLSISYYIQWEKSSWLKGAIEKGANEGQIDYVKALLEHIRKAKDTKPGKRKKSKKSRKQLEKQPDEEAAVEEVVEEGAAGIMPVIVNVLTTAVNWLSQPRNMFNVLLLFLLCLQFWYLRKLIKGDVTWNPALKQENPVFPGSGSSTLRFDESNFNSWLNTRLKSLVREHEPTLESRKDNHADANTDELQAAADYMVKRLTQLKSELDKAKGLSAS
ncbi:GRAM domain-containing protein [Schizosaccharomyces japonicus yFS275]|uniref:GRAM domain-containing protein n=1 Tax=Schizosaccharomyces japonicus (strain yFS275 / FY16936) TaxID=402676 RepID=B6K0D6_SCHJY|nr:GRAM domain-containing protein [Schizosaccharomyces japonicus yFS275]EEB06286.1 GRAM domain-containing protein [Schizosaccharomyces japonicus yFS275]